MHFIKKLGFRLRCNTFVSIGNGLLASCGGRNDVDVDAINMIFAIMYLTIVRGSDLGNRSPSVRRRFPACLLHSSHREVHPVHQGLYEVGVIASHSSAALARLDHGT